MHYRQSLVIESCLLCTVFDSHLSKLSYGYHMVETFTNFQENGDIRWQLGPMDVKAQGVSGAGRWPHRVQNELRRDQKVFLFITSIVSNHQLSYSWSYEYMHPQVNPRRFRRQEVASGWSPSDYSVTKAIQLVQDVPHECRSLQEIWRSLRR